MGASRNSNGEKDEGELGYLVHTPHGRVNVDGKLQSQKAFIQLESGVTPPPTGPDDRADRTQSPDTNSLDTTGVWNHVFNRIAAGTSSLTVQRTTSQSRIGLDPITSTVITAHGAAGSARASFTLDGSTPNWMWTANVGVRGLRILARVENLFDAAPDVRDASGAAPYADRPALLNPAGRIWEIGLRKLF